MPEIRHATHDDLDAVFDLLSARSRAAFGISQVERRFVEHDFTIEGTDPFVAIEDGAIVGYAALNSAQDLAHTASDPAVGDTLLAHVEERARERGFDSLAVVAAQEDAPLAQLVERSGFAHDCDVLRMWRVLNGDLPEPRWPEGVTVRDYADADSERVHALLDASYAGWDKNYVARPHADWLAFMTDHAEFDPALWFLVERDGELVGCSLHWKETNGRGWVKDIVVAESERGHGIGAALLQHAFRTYKERGVERVGLKVDSTNPTGALRLYERAGFVTDQTLGVWIKQL